MANEIKKGIILNFGEIEGGIASILTAYIKKNPGVERNETATGDLIKDIINVAGIDTKIWQVKSFKLTPNTWGVTMKQKNFKAGMETIGKDAEGKAVKAWAAESETWAEQAQNHQLKIEIFFERIAPNNRDEFKKEVIKEIMRRSKKIAIPAYIKRNLGELSLVDIPDHHLARLSYGKETGDNYDMKIAVKRYEDSMVYFLEEMAYRAVKHPLEQILYVLGNDFFNYDYAKPYPHTSNNTPQESDVRFQKMFKVGSGLVIRQIEETAKIAPVKVIVLPGNHDEQLAFMLGQVVEARFINNPNIDVETAPTLRKYHQFGKNMLAFSHGQYESFERLFANMAFEDMPAWSKSIYKFMYLGHMHHKETRVKLSQDVETKIIKFPKKPVLMTEDLNGILFDRLASLTSNDYYESSRGYIHIKMAESFFYHKEFGCRGSLKYQLPLSIHSKGNR